MKLIIDTDAQTLTSVDGHSQLTRGLYTKEAFEAISAQWVRVGWSLRYYFNFSWFGSLIQQMPEDMVRLQEVVYRVQPDVIIETGVWRGGSILFHASLCQALGKGWVIGIDQNIRADTRAAIQQHRFGFRITLIQGDSASPEVINRVAGLLRPSDTVLVILDSCHTKEHVRSELENYAQFVTPGSYIVATDGIMKDLADVPGGHPEWVEDNPFTAATEFAARHPEFEQTPPPWPFHESELTENITYWPGAWLKRLH